ncbi:unnamed protein product [Cuscuta epithymum]|uniref:Uncharacterized protein n=1 Tax=Cuscuta epithymum TaxID=186058 RepID=A0AAV0D787_9ASTE|nr:unnamed protein product [Cuscuta epithymum]
MGLDTETYGNLRSNILGADDLPSLTKVYNMIVQEERLQSLTRGREQKHEAVAFVARTGPTGGKDEREKCSYCQKFGHDFDNCFRRTGNYPEWWYENPGRARGGRGRGGSSRGGAGRGGTGRGTGRGTAHAMHVGELQGDGTPAQGTKEMVLHKPGFTDEQWQVLIKLMENCKTSSSGEKLTGPTYEDADWSG